MLLILLLIGFICFIVISGQEAFKIIGKLAVIAIFLALVLQFWFIVIPGLVILYLVAINWRH